MGTKVKKPKTRLPTCNYPSMISYGFKPKKIEQKLFLESKSIKTIYPTNKVNTSNILKF